MTPWFDPSLVFIGGAWRAAACGDTLPVIDPSTGAEIARIARGTSADIDAAVHAAEAALAGEWGALPAFARGRILARLGQLIIDHIDPLTAMEAADVGKPLAQARNDVIAMARYCEFYAGAADKLMGETIPFKMALPSIPCANPTASRATSCRGTTRCRSSAARSVPHLPQETPVS